MRTRFLPAVAVVAATAFMLAGCGGSGHKAAQSGASSMPGMSNMPEVPATQAAPVGADQVSIKNFAFAPGTVKVHVGTTVTWTNVDQEAHTVTSMSGVFKSAALNPSATFHFTFTKAGTFPYQCTIHPFMHGTVVVTP